MKTFKETNYKIVKKAIDSELFNFLYNYLILKANVVDNLFKNNYIEQFNKDWGYFGDDPQSNIKETYWCYSDFAFESLLLKLKEKMESITKMELIPNYSYVRLYRKGSILEKHKDRYSCGISATLNLGGDPWPIYIEPDPKYGNITPDHKYIKGTTEGIKIKLNPGDMLVYNGIDCEHWRETFQGEKCGQVFLHYQEKSELSLKNSFDGRPFLGFPSFYSKRP